MGASLVEALQACCIAALDETIPEARQYTALIDLADVVMEPAPERLRARADLTCRVVFVALQRLSGYALTNNTFMQLYFSVNIWVLCNIPGATQGEPRGG